MGKKPRNSILPGALGLSGILHAVGLASRSCDATTTDATHQDGLKAGRSQKSMGKSLDHQKNHWKHLLGKIMLIFLWFIAGIINTNEGFSCTPYLIGGWYLPKHQQQGSQREKQGFSGKLKYITNQPMLAYAPHSNDHLNGDNMWPCLKTGGHLADFNENI